MPAAQGPQREIILWPPSESEHRPFRTAVSSRWSLCGRLPVPVRRASEGTTRAWSNRMIPSEGPGCFVYLPSPRSTVGVAQCGVFVFVALVPRCRHMLLHVGRSDRWFSLPIICRCWSLSLVQSPVEPALRLAWHAQPTDSPRLPRFPERSFCHSRQRRDTRDEQGHRFGSDRQYLQHGDRTEHPLRSVPSYTTRKGMVVLAVASRAENHKPAVSPPRPSHAMTGFPSSGDNKRLSTLLWRLK